ncbi:orotidine-5'-phosphate decarboxylase [Pontibacter diazotrophicus]|uniref:Orotidine 5'-phosphate decarboxylase n=1 Tax=Pontibacter diazotrophicus TaxID=1400979 RepID=A0A3D8LFQ8_9BACT|nr:orotidine-5'-phosphate decarboxylase [Pontibacter diazotrophicus]RDV16074.1 orotidine-5'-phosphate decarboxylase [Pontibacter diazotrophicus]
MTREQLFEQILKKKSYLCVGLDTDPKKLPQHLLDTEDPVFEFNRQIIEATADLCVAYKPNIAFYEAQGPQGWVSLEKTLQVIPENIFTIADAKRGDIGNTSELYARAFFETMQFDSVTVAPYMGADSVKPFLVQEGKWVILLALTSNAGSQDFQMLRLEDGNEEYLFEQVLRTSATWATADQMMYVIGATQAEYVQRVRKLVPNHFLLVPGVGAQGGSLEDISRLGMNQQCGLLVNSARGIIYASSGRDFAAKAREAALAVQREMEVCLEQYVRHV